ncbi:MAG: PRC-barrel domain-containing protein [Solirubrobacterales bacterium]
MLAAGELRGSSAPGAAEARTWIGSRVEDVYGAGVGRVEDVIVDDGGVPAWLIVREGRFNTHHVALPFEGAVGTAGHVWVPHSKDAIKGAPRVGENRAIEGSLEARLREHYAELDRTLSLNT